MRRIVKLHQAHRVLAMFLAIVMITSVMPFNAFAANPGVVTTDVDEKDIVVGTPVEFTVTTVAHDDANKMVRGNTVFSDSSAIETLEYYEVKDGNWYTFAGEFGPETGFPMADATSRFRVTFNKAGTYTADILIQSVEDSSVVCSTSATIEVKDLGKVTTDLGDISFVAGEMTEFTCTTVANANAGKMVKGSFEFSDPTAIDALEYYETQDGNWYPLTGDFGPATGFPMMDATSRFRVRFARAGSYPVTIMIKSVEDGSLVCSTTTTATVGEPGSVTTNLDEITFVVGEMTEFTCTTVPNANAGKMIKGSFEFSDPAVIAALEYYETQDGNWYPLTGDFGPATGFPMINATSRFRVRFAQAGNYPVTIMIKSVEDGSLVCSTTVTATVGEPGSVSTNLDEITFVAGEMTEFTCTTVPNANAGKMVKGSFEFSDPTAIDVLEYYETQDGNWYPLTGDFGPATGFPMMDATSRFRVRFAKSGSYPVTIMIKSVEDGSIVCSTTEAAVVGEPGSVSTNIGDIAFVARDTLEFTCTTVANANAGKMVKGSFLFSDLSAIATLEYYETQDGNWYPLTGDFGPATGFPMMDATSRFRVRFAKSGSYSVTVMINSVEDGSVVCSTAATVEVGEPGSVDTSVDDITFVANRTDEFTCSTVANADAGRMVVGYFEFSEPSAIGLIEYYEVQDGNWYSLTGDFGPVTGFPMTDATSKFRVTFNQAGTYTVTTYIKEVGTDNILCSVTETVTVKTYSPISFTEENTEIKYSDVNASNDSLNDLVSGAEYTYRSEDESIVRIDEHGILIPVGIGEATITVTRKENSDYVAAVATYTVKVVPGDQNALVWNETVPSSIKWNAPAGYSNTVSGGSGNGAITYASSDPLIADVDPDTGVLTLKKPGTVTITATKSGATLYHDVQTSYTLEVIKSEQAPLVFDEANPNAVYVGEKYTNAVTGGSTGGAVVYASSDDTIVTVDATGKITALKVPTGMDCATVEITASLAGNEYYENAISVSYTLTVYRAVQTNVLVFEKGTVGQTIKYGDSYTNAATGGDTGPITYKSSDETIATVSADGEITAWKAGTVTITVSVPETEVYQEQTLSYDLVIQLADQSVTFANGNTNLPDLTYGDTYQNVASATTAITYRSSDDTIAEVDADGNLIIHKSGRVTITATAAETEQYAQAAVSYEIMINKADQTISLEKGEQIVVTFNDDNNQFSNPSSSNATTGDADDRKDITVRYSVDSGAEFIDMSTFDTSTGEFTIIGAGTICISVTFSTNDRYKSNTASYTLTVEKDDQAIAFDQASYSMINGDNAFTAPVALEMGDKYGTGNIIYSIEVNDDGVVSAIDPDTGALTFTNAIGSVTILATKVADDNYNMTTTQYTLVVEEWLTGTEKFYSMTGETKNTSGWFTGNVSITAKSGYLVSYEKTVGEADWQEVLVDTVTDDGEYTRSFYVKNIANGYISELQTETIFKDSVAPTLQLKCETVSAWQNFYDEDVALSVQFSDAQPMSGIYEAIYEVLKDGVVTQRGTFNIADPTDRNILVDSVANNSDNVVVKVTIVDVAGHVTVDEVSLIICITPPTIDVSYINDPQEIEVFEGVTYYNANRVAQIVITGRTSVFNVSTAPNLVITETKGDTASGTTYEVIDWVVNEVPGDPDAATHTCLVKFNGSANYEFKLDYTDIFGNGLTHESNKFVVDHDTPTASVTIDENNTWTRLLEILTFGLWKNDQVTVKASADDATSPIRSIEYYKSNSNVILTAAQLADVTWTAFEEIKIKKDEQFAIYLKVTDRAGQVSYICSDAYIVDMQASNIVITPDQPNENGIYGGDFNVKFDISEIAPYSGIKTVDYWVICDGTETIRKNLYTYTASSLPIQSELKASFTETITVNAAENNSDNVSVFVKVVDNAGNEKIEKIENLKVDVVAPKIDVSFSTNEANVVDGRGYIKTNRVATIVFTERTSNFNKEKATAGIVLSGVDSAGAPITLDRSTMIRWGETVEVENDPDAATHTVYVYFTTDANYEFSVSYTDQAGHACDYADVAFADGTVAPRFFTIDKAEPTGEITVAGKSWAELLEELTFGIFTNKTVTVSAIAKDNTSPVIVEYHKTNLVDLLKKEDLDAMPASAWTLFSEFDVSTDDRFVIYLKVTDYAGNYCYVSTSGHVVDMTKAELVLTPEYTTLYHGLIPLYHKDVNVQINVKEMKDETYSGINKVEYWVVCDGVETQREVLYTFDKENPTYAELLETFAANVVIDSKLNNSCDVVLYVGVTGNAGNYVEKHVAVDIDITAPEIKITYDNNNAYKVVDNKGYYPGARTATVVITERTAHFDALKATEGIKITAVNSAGEVVIGDCSALIKGWTTEGSGNSATHTATISFAADANYTLAVSYTDLAKNSNADIDVGDSKTPYVFAVDTNAPTGTVSAGALGTWNKLISNLTFGLFTMSTVNLSGTSADATTPIESVSYYKTPDTKAKTARELNAINTWTTFNGLSVHPDEQFVLYVRIVDYAGNTTYISTNGIIVDDTSPDIESIEPEIAITPAYGIYDSNVSISVTVSDPDMGTTAACAGLQEISYEIYNMNILTQSGVLFYFDNPNPLVEEFQEYWGRTDAIEVDKKLNNSNDVRIVVYASDNAGNSTSAEYSLKIDITDPEISVSYDNNNGDTTFGDQVYFNGDRTAKIVITERNFDPTMVDVIITNTDGYIPSISEWTTVRGTGNGDDTTHTAYVVFDVDGDYTLSVSCADKASNSSAAVDFADNLAPEAFTIDKTVPVVDIVYDNDDALNGNYYKADRVATITVTEHNFETDRVQIHLKATDDGVEKDLPTVSQWISDGDTHTATITYAADGLYTFDFDYTDKAGNVTADISEHVFYIDKTNPVLTIEKIVDESANNAEGNIGFVMTATDTNFDTFIPSLTAVVRNGDTFEIKKLEIGEITDTKNGKVFTVTNIEADGIYRITCTIVDKAGNAYSEVTLENAEGAKYVEQRAEKDTLVTFSVNRNGSTFEVDENTVGIVSQYYVKNLDNDIVLVEINVDPLKEYKISLNGKALTEGTDYTVTSESGNGSWVQYTYKVNKSLFDGEGEYTLVVSSKDEADNDAFSDIKNATVTFVVDRTAPIVTVSGIANDGRYQTDKQLVTLIPTDDGGALKTLIVNMVDENGNLIQEIINLSGDMLTAELEANGGMITFEIAEGLYQNVQIICTDQAIGENGESNTFDTTIRNISVSSSMFKIFWANEVLRWSVIGGVSATAIALAAFVIFKRKKLIPV